MIEEKIGAFFDVEFVETNPQPIKTALAWAGRCKEAFRLPMCGMEERNKEKLKKVCQELNLI